MRLVASYVQNSSMSKKGKQDGGQKAKKSRTSDAGPAGNKLPRLLPVACGKSDGREAARTGEAHFKDMQMEPRMNTDKIKGR